MPYVRLQSVPRVRSFVMVNGEDNEDPMVHRQRSSVRTVPHVIDVHRRTVVRSSVVPIEPIENGLKVGLAIDQVAQDGINRAQFIPRQQLFGAWPPHTQDDRRWSALSL